MDNMLIVDNQLTNQNQLDKQVRLTPIPIKLTLVNKAKHTDKIDS